VQGQLVVSPAIKLAAPLTIKLVNAYLHAVLDIMPQNLLALLALPLVPLAMVLEPPLAPHALDLSIIIQEPV
jgi:hypothetical protein